MSTKAKPRKLRVWRRWACEYGRMLHVFSTYGAAEEWSNSSVTPFRVEIREAPARGKR